MKAFTIDAENNISAFATSEEAAATTVTPFDTFTSQKELLSLIGQWPAERLVAIWNGLPGVKPVKGFKNARTAAGRMWAGIQSLGDVPKLRTERKPKGGAQAATGAATKGKATKKTTSTKRAPKAQKAAKAEESGGPREGSKTARVVVMLQRKNGATLEEIMDQMGWQKHTVRGFMAGAMKKAGYSVESFKSDKGERSYRINP
jgi:Protein of unknown function (DUF3489)